jgi:hypothetical protein
MTWLKEMRRFGSLDAGAVLAELARAGPVDRPAARRAPRRPGAGRASGAEAPQRRRQGPQAERLRKGAAWD